jgi:predicted nucleic acid-binding protein
MTSAFVDAFFWLALINPRDAHHAAAVAYPLPSRLVTSAAVMIEVMDACAAVRKRRTATAFWSQCWTSSNLEVMPLTPDLLHRAANLYAQRADKEWSLTDCISFVIMGDLGLQLALTADKHFEQAGFQRAFS